MIPVRSFSLLCSLLLLISMEATAQQVDYSRIVPPSPTHAKTFPDYLVQRAWINNANNDALLAKVAISSEEVKLAQRSWMDAINFNIGFSNRRDSVYGAFGFGDPATANTYLSPGFNYGVSFGLGGLVNSKTNVRIAKEKKRIANNMLNQEKLQLRAIVLQRLENYDNSQELLRIRRQAKVDAETNYNLVQSLFERGKAQFEDLAQASDVYHRSVESVAQAESNLRMAKYAIEEITGDRWESLLVVRQRMDVRRK